MADAKIDTGAASEGAVKVDAPAAGTAEATSNGTSAKEATASDNKPDEAAPVAEEPKAAAAASEEKKVDAAVATPEETSVEKLASRLPGIMDKAGWKEMWTVKLVDAKDVPTSIVLQKFINANNGDVDAAEKQLTSALEWRKKVNPGELVSKAFNKAKFGGIGYVTTHKKVDSQLVVTWNVYGKVKNFKETFGDIEEFIQWRAALMELGVRKLGLESATERLPTEGGGEDRYQMVQVHDYLDVSFFRMDPAVKAASRETITTFATAYPELLSHKYFVNVPAVMGWVFGVMKLFLSPATLRKFHPMSSGSSLFGDVKCNEADFPKEYGGKGPSVTEGETVRLVEMSAEKKKEDGEQEAVEAPKAEAKAETGAKETSGTAEEPKKS